jgi:hypothetical protein
LSVVSSLQIAFVNHQVLGLTAQKQSYKTLTNRKLNCFHGAFTPNVLTTPKNWRMREALSVPKTFRTKVKAYDCSQKVLSSFCAQNLSDPDFNGSFGGSRRGEIHKIDARNHQGNQSNR